MSNTVNNGSDLVSASVPNVAQVVEIARKSKVKTAKDVTQDVSALTVNAAFKAAKETDSALFDFSVSLTAMMLDSISRKLHRKEVFEANAKDPSKLPGKITESNNDVMYALQVKCAFKGAQIYLDTAAHVADIAAMPNGRLEERTIEGRKTLLPNPDLQAKLAAARNYVSGTYVWREVERNEAGSFVFDLKVTKDENGNDVENHVPRVKEGATGRMLPVATRKEDIAAKYPGAKAKALVSSFATARRMSNFLVKWFWFERRSYLNELANRETAGLTVDDMNAIRAIITDTFGGTFVELETAYKSGRPAPSATKGFVERVQDMVSNNKKITLEEVKALSAYFNQLLATKSRGTDDSEMAAGLVPVEMIAGDEDSDDAAPLTGTNG